MRFTRRRLDLPAPARRRLGSSVEFLESRELLSNSGVNQVFAPWFPRELPVSNPITHQPVLVTVNSLLNRHNPQSPFLTNKGKIVSGKDRAGNEWTITVHGPGIVIVTDISPNDGILDDNIDTIQLVGTDSNRTYVTGEVLSSYRTPTDGTVLFNRLIDADGVKSIALNGFTLTDTVTNLLNSNSTTGTLIPQNSQTGIFLNGGVQYLQFHDILAPIDTSTNDQPINIIIGGSSTPLKVAPTIKLDSIFNTVFDSSAPIVPGSPQTPQTQPTVKIVVNGQIKSLDYISSTQHAPFDPAQAVRALEEFRFDSSSTTFNPTRSPIVGAGNQFQFPVVGTTGRTAIQANGINTLNVRGSAVNTTFSRGPVPFQNSFSGLNHLGHARFGGTADALRIDVNGPIGSLRFHRGLGNPTGAPRGTNVNATQSGTPPQALGYPSAGLPGGIVTARRIGRIQAGPANTLLQTSTNPNYAQLWRQGNTAFFARAGNALTNAAIVSSGPIGKVQILGNQQNSEIKSGFA